MRGERFIDFAKRIGVDQSSAYQLVKLWQHKTAILARCKDDGRSYGWETCLYWHEPAPRQRRNQSDVHSTGDGRNDERRTSPAIFQRYGSQCTLDVAATPRQRAVPGLFTKKPNALKQRWHGVAWMNPPYRNLAPCCQKAVEHARAGGTVTVLLPSRTDAVFFHESCVLGRITFIRNRLVFLGGPGAHAPFASMIVEWNAETVMRDHTLGLDAMVSSARSGVPIAR